MALITCPECRGRLSTRAARCPHCGAPNDTGRLRLVQVLPWCLTAILGLILLVGGSSGGRSPAPESLYPPDPDPQYYLPAQDTTVVWADSAIVPGSAASDTPVPGATTDSAATEDYHPILEPKDEPPTTSDARVPTARCEDGTLSYWRIAAVPAPTMAASPSGSDHAHQYTRWLLDTNTRLPQWSPTFSWPPCNGIFGMPGRAAGSSSPSRSTEPGRSCTTSSERLRKARSPDTPSHPSTDPSRNIPEPAPNTP